MLYRSGGCFATVTFQIVDQRAQELDELVCFVEERYAFQFELDELDKNPAEVPQAP